MKSETVIALLKIRQGDLNKRDYAKQLGVSQQYLHDVMTGRRPLGPKILSAINFERHVDYRKATTHELRNMK